MVFTPTDYQPFPVQVQRYPIFEPGTYSITLVITALPLSPSIFQQSGPIPH